MGLAPIIESAGSSGPGECVGADGLIDPSQFACRASDLQPSRVEMAGEELKALGDAVRWEITGIAADWAGLRPWYVAPEQESMLGLMNAPADDARDLQECLRTASNALATYAGELVPIQRDLADLEWRAGKFREEVRHGVMVPVSESGRPTLLQAAVGLLGGAEPEVLVYWRESAEVVAENAALLAEYAQILERLSTAADAVENTILGLLTDATSLEDTTPIPAESFDAHYVEMPWGWPAKEDMNVLEDIADGGGRVWEGLLAFLPMLGIDPATGRVGPAVAVQSWLGMGNVLGSVALATAYPESTHPWFAQLPWMQERYRTAETAGLLAGYDAVAGAAGESPWHEWRDNPWATGIDTAFNVLSFLAPTAGAARFAGLSARTARWARITGVGADFLVPGGSYAVAGAARVTSDLADLARFGDRIPGIGARPAGLVDAASRTRLSDEMFETTAEGAGGAGVGDAVTGAGSTEAGATNSTGTSAPVGGQQSSTGGIADSSPGATPGGTDSGGGGPANGGGGGGGGSASGTASGPDGPRPLSQAEVTAYQSLRPLTLDDVRGATYGSGDIHRPGLDPTRTPAQTYLHGQSTHGWRPLGTSGSPDSIAYQTQVTGVDRLPNGMRSEYTVMDANGNLVDYDGHVVRGKPPEEIFLEAKFGYHEFATDPNGQWAAERRDKVVSQARQQLDALPPGARLEWHVSDARGAAALKKLLIDQRLQGIDVIYTPVT